VTVTPKEVEDNYIKLVNEAIQERYDKAIEDVNARREAEGTEPLPKVDLSLDTPQSVTLPAYACTN
jgi:hypothetical protein